MNWKTKLPALDRRRVIAATAAAFAAPAVLRAQTAPEFVTVETPSGRLRGRRVAGVDVFKGVPYGDAVSGAGRFKPARVAAAWTGVRDALSLGTPSLQHPETVYGLNEPAPGEDCLVLNVWAPAGGGKRPVMFYSHGGGFTTGSGGSVTQDGSNLAREYDVVVVSTNHRLGLLGYLYLGELGGEAYAGSGNQGMSDIVLGLDWTRRHIAAFGGDPDNIMIFGESGGGAKTSCLYAMPSVAPMFAKAAIQSGPAVRVGTPETAAKTTRMVLEEMGLAPTDWRRLFDAPAPAFLQVQAALSKRLAGGAPGGWRGIAEFRPGGYGPILQPGLLPAHPFDPAAPATARDKPLIVGWNDSEAAFFALESKDFSVFSLDEAGLRARLAHDLGARADEAIAAYRSDRPQATPTDIYLAIQSVRSMGEGSMLIAERKTAQRAAPAYYYNLAYRSNRKPPGVDRELGAMYAIDIPLVFDNATPTDTLAGSRPDRIAAARAMSAFWTSFAHTGRPAAPGAPAWRPYDLARRPTMVIDVECSLVEDRHAPERHLWAKLDPAG